MDPELKEKLLSSYLSEDESEELSRMIGRSKGTVLKDALISLDVADKPEYLRGSAVIFDDTSAGEGFTIGRYSIVNVTEESQESAIEIVIDRSRIIKREFVVSPKETKDGLICLTDKESEGLDGQSVECRLEISDSIGRTVFKTVSAVTMNSGRSATKVSANLRFGDCGEEGKSTALNIRIRSDDDIERNCSISVFADSQLLLEKKYAISSGEAIEDIVDIPLDSEALSCMLKAMAICEGAELTNASKEVVRIVRTAEPLVTHSSKPIFADLGLETVVDIHEQQSGMVTLGVLGVRNSDDSQEHVTWSICIDGEIVDHSGSVLEPGSKKDIPITAPVKILSKDDTFSVTVRCSLLDSDSKIVLDRVGQVTVRSRFDMNLHKLRELTAKYVNPLDPDVKHFVDSKDGLLSKAMGDRYIVSGYQSPSEMIPQLESVYNAIRDNGMAYVSDIVIDITK